MLRITLGILLVPFLSPNSSLEEVLEEAAGGNELKLCKSGNDSRPDRARSLPGGQGGVFLAVHQNTQPRITVEPAARMVHKKLGPGSGTPTRVLE
ncbi:2-C-methyl-D-erythritol 4-phosphate cytidylyltransferase [Anopheles sinensis]|uniref:2-C-methyl-D-erythritol 4-phosphate cytidylyltransferase n=1 Tax=Anopheles sinensis TaxID=74873 RepID=A0A084V9U1_ANOSI|nr:2-C-methyl-D-erythritol 4-phosphate cytidylyltransferase [Anopheles sinensis]